MEIKTNKDNNVLTISIKGRLDTMTSPELMELINQATPESSKIILDAAGLEYISSAGIRVLVTAHKLMAARDGFTVRAPNENVMEIIRLTGLASVLDIVQ